MWHSCCTFPEKIESIWPKARSPGQENWYIHSTYPKLTLVFFEGTHVPTLHGSWPILSTLSGYVYFIEHYKVLFEVCISFTRGSWPRNVKFMGQFWNNFSSENTTDSRFILLWTCYNAILYRCVTNFLSVLPYFSGWVQLRLCEVNIRFSQ